ncbi:MAG: phosphonate ABC transporter substrate-binding protein [Candidatus Accumulibacter sp.]|jgi:phosphonate transport system substrate-binding protein|nr:phosphonate ABC transporter substrate-binding protein [Accumulibacter sp.]
MRDFFKRALNALNILGVLCFCLALPAAAQTQKEINFGIISTESSSNLRNIWDPFLADMSRQTGFKVNAFFASDYAGIIQGIRFDKVDIAWMGNKAAMEAVDRAGAEVIAQTVAANGDAGYWSVLLAHKDSPYTSVEEVLKNAREISFGNGDPNSTSGFLVPGYYVFAQNGVDPKQIFKRTLNANHEANALAVANKHVDIATNNTENLDRLKITAPDKFQQLKVIWKSPLIPSDPLVIRKNLDAGTQKTLKDFLFGYGKNAEEKKKLEALQWAPFRVSNDDQLLPIRQLELFKQQATVKADGSLSEKEKNERLNEINAELAKLDRRMKDLELARK